MEGLKPLPESTKELLETLQIELELARDRTRHLESQINQVKELARSQGYEVV